MLLALPLHDGKSGADHFGILDTDTVIKHVRSEITEEIARRTNTTDICIVKGKRTWTSGDPWYAWRPPRPRIRRRKK